MLEIGFQSKSSDGKSSSLKEEKTRFNGGKNFLKMPYLTFTLISRYLKHYRSIITNAIRNVTANIRVTVLPKNIFSGCSENRSQISII